MQRRAEGGVRKTELMGDENSVVNRQKSAVARIRQRR